MGMREDLSLIAASDQLKTSDKYNYIMDVEVQ
jgi:hypothetical protein